MAQGGGRVGVAEGDEAFPGRLRAQPRLARRELGDRVEQRAVEQLLVQPAYDRAVPLPLAGQPGHRVGAQAQRAAEAAQVGLRLRDEVGAAQAVQLDAVLHGAQEAVRLVQPGRVLTAHVAARGQGPQGVQGGAAAQGGVGAAVHQLEELHGELHVAQAARAELELPVDLGRGDVLHHPAAHLLHVRHEVVPLGRLPDEGVQRVQVRLAERRVAGHRAGLEQGLELPGLGPALVVGDVAAEGAHEGAVAALGAEVGVHRPDGALHGRLRADPHQVGGEFRGGPQCLGFRGALRRFRHEDHVDVGDVVQFVAAALAHRDHREAAGGGVLGGGVLGEGQGRAEGGGGQVGEFARGLGDVRGAADVAGGDGEQAAAVGDAEGDRVGGLGQAAFELRDARVEVVRFVRDQGVPVGGVAGEVVGEGGGGAEDAEEAVAEGLAAMRVSSSSRWAVGVGWASRRRTRPCRARSGSAVAPRASRRTGSSRTVVSSGPSRRRSAAEGSVKPCRSRRVKVLLLRPGVMSVVSSWCVRRPGQSVTGGGAGLGLWGCASAGAGALWVSRDACGGLCGCVVVAVAPTVVRGSGPRRAVSVLGPAPCSSCVAGLFAGRCGRTQPATSPSRRVRPRVRGPSPSPARRARARVASATAPSVSLPALSSGGGFRSWSVVLASFRLPSGRRLRSSC